MGAAFLDVRQAAVDEVAYQLAGQDASLGLQRLQMLDLAYAQPNRVRHQAIFGECSVDGWKLR